MKTFFVAFAFCFAASAFSQTKPSGYSDLTTTNAGATNVTYSIVSRDANSRLWAKITLQTNAAGEVQFLTNNAYTELATGICYEDGTNWADSVEEIDIVADGASGTKTRHKVHFMGNANAPGGAVHLTTPDNKDFFSRVYGLAYWDSATGTNVLVAPLQDSAGVVVGNNRVVYTNAFSGSVSADIEYVYTLAGLEQNVVIRSQIYQWGAGKERRCRFVLAQADQPQFGHGHRQQHGL